MNKLCWVQCMDKEFVKLCLIIVCGRKILEGSAIFS